jgi:hypothetical protein
MSLQWAVGLPVCPLVLGVRLGATGAERAVRYKAEARARAIELAPILRDLKQEGLSLRGMAAELTKRRVPTPRGGAWHPQLVTACLRGSKRSESRRETRWP